MSYIHHLYHYSLLDLFQKFQKMVLLTEWHSVLPTELPTYWVSMMRWVLTIACVTEFVMVLQMVSDWASD